MKQRLGAKKHRRCEEISGRSYCVCYVSAKYGHGWAECWYGDGAVVHDADEVNYLLPAVKPKIREGQFVPSPLEELAALVGR